MVSDGAGCALRLSCLTYCHIRIKLAATSTTDELAFLANLIELSARSRQFRLSNEPKMVSDIPNLRYIKHKVAEPDQVQPWRHVSFSARTRVNGYKAGSRILRTAATRMRSPVQLAGRSIWSIRKVLGADEETDDPLRDVKKAPGLLFPRL